uniref:Uncharacterized protein n=1 Tax=Anguilla anguilla TaxID=7936 RepID=A0A0E9PQ85_ANGAN
MVASTLPWEEENGSFLCWSLAPLMN